MSYKVERNPAKLVAIYFVIMFSCVLLATWIFVPEALSLSLIISSGLSSAVTSFLITRILNKSGNIAPDDAARAEYVERAQAGASKTLHWSRSPILWVGGATAVLFCFLHFVVIG